MVASKLSHRRQIVGAGLDRLGRRRTALSDHLARRLDSDHGSIRRFVGTGAGADIQNSLRRPECALDDPCYPPIRLAQLRIVDSDDVILRAHRAFLPQITDICKGSDQDVPSSIDEWAAKHRADLPEGRTAWPRRLHESRSNSLALHERTNWLRHAHRLASVFGDPLRQIRPGEHATDIIRKLVNHAGRGASRRHIRQIGKSNPATPASCGCRYLREQG